LFDPLLICDEISNVDVKPSGRYFWGKNEKCKTIQFEIFENDI
jgi:hypothetical protein